jgi:hypothetical protein
MKFKTLIILLPVIATLTACNRPNNNEGFKNPAAEGFDQANSDPAAVELADSIMEAMGGWENWNNTRFISWNFFGNRNLVWDKKEERARIESLNDSITYLINLKTVTGKVWVKGQLITESDSLNKMLHRAKSIWINDSYWLVMPFKLKDSGVTLKYLGEDTLKTGGRCNVLQLTFNNVGDTPQNKYHVYVDLADNLVKQWAYYSNASQDTASFIRPWDNYKRYGRILLSADRSDGGGPKDVSVANTLDEKIFTELEGR